MKLVLVLAFTLVAMSASNSVAGAQEQRISTSEHWVSTWATALDLAPSVMEIPVVSPGTKMPDFSKLRARGPKIDLPPKLDDQTIRMIVHTSIGGSRVRIEISNAIGKNAVVIGAAHIALRSSGAETVNGSDRALTFGGKASVTMQPGVTLLSDPVDLKFTPLSDLAVSLYFPRDTGPPTSHALGLHRAYVSRGDTTATEAMPNSDETHAYLWLSAVDVLAPSDSFAVVALGDSITDGFATTADADQAWPSQLAKRLLNNEGTKDVSVLNQGISGNEVLKDGAGVSALVRFDRDVLSSPGIEWMIVLEGINDINIHGQVAGPVALTAEDVIFGYRQIIDRAHTHGIKVIGATLMPEEGVWLATPQGEATRQSVNAWIRTSQAFDQIVDLDKVTRDPIRPAILRQEFDSGDHIHPNDAGNKAIADAFNLSTFKQ
jgi:lysophospholipase L1-like esterase